jgi:nitrogen fixation NifU-like protein
MDAETRDLFESSLLDLAKARTHEGPLTDPSGQAHAKNPFCGDEVTVDVRLDAATRAMTALGYEAKACSLCVASAELLSGWVADGAGTVEELDGLLAQIKATLGADAAAPEGFEALASVAPFRARHRCVTLPLEAACEAGASASKDE